MISAVDIHTLRSLSWPFNYSLDVLLSIVVPDLLLSSNFSSALWVLDISGFLNSFFSILREFNFPFCKSLALFLAVIWELSFKIYLLSRARNWLFFDKVELLIDSLPLCRHRNVFIHCSIVCTFMSILNFSRVDCVLCRMVDIYIFLAHSLYVRELFFVIMDLINGLSCLYVVWHLDLDWDSCDLSRNYCLIMLHTNCASFFLWNLHWEHSWYRHFILNLDWWSLL